ncbi:MAG TPA: UvrD-helicase domain-containing protein, partial [Solirubrobacteraceae bacterium]|nr:UvrD-helicase domain-containing protein [Solirubrobacteraceae bacterium]
IGTFHAFCARLLRTRALLAGLDPAFEILDEGLAARLRERAFADVLGEFVAGGAKALELVAAYGADALAQMIGAVYSQLRSAGQRTPRLPRPSASGEPEDEAEAIAAAGLLDALLALFGDRYAARKRERGAVDFDDLELAAGDLLRDHEEVCARWSGRFDLLMVDELQDTNRRQLAILEALARDNLFTVGDELQAIYSFRHADVDLFRARRAELAPRGASLRLTGNFRSRPALLDAVNAIFGARFEDGPGLVPMREEARGRGGPRVELLLTARAGWEQDEMRAREIAQGLPTCPLWRQAEARALARRVGELVESGAARPGEIVVLLRAVPDMEVYEGALAQRGLSTLATVGGFWERQQVADLLCYLRALANPLDEPALLGVLASPLVGISSAGLARLADGALANGRGLWHELRDADSEGLAAFGSHEREQLEGFRERFARERAAAASRPIAKLIERVLEHSAYRERVLELAAGRERVANIHKLLRLAGRFEATEGRDLRAFLDYVGRREASSDRAEPDAPVPELDGDAVRLMSVHAAKGLEFAVVCVADLGRTPKLGVPDLVVEGDLIGLRLARLREGTREPALHYALLQERGRRAQAAEEDRILYVAMTRARERLLLSGAVDLASWPDQRIGAAPIAWLGPALAAELPERTGTGASIVFDQPLDGGCGEVRVRLNAPAPQASLPGFEPSPDERPNVAEPLTTAPGGASSPRRRRAPAGETREPEPAPRPPEALTLSYTALSRLERCGYRYYLEHVIGMPERRDRGGDAGDGLGGRARGILVHRLLETVDFARSPAVGDDDVARAARELSLRVSERERSEIAALVSAVSDGSPDRRPARGSPAARLAAAAAVRREHPFAFSLGPGEPLLSGVIDLLAEDGEGGALVLDYKTDRVGESEDIESLVVREYGVQRLLYALAVLRGGATRVEIVHWFLRRPDEWVSVSYDRAQQPELQERLRARVAAAWRFDVSPKPRRELCESCPGRGTLCSYEEALTLAS